MKVMLWSAIIAGGLVAGQPPVPTPPVAPPEPEAVSPIAPAWPVLAQARTVPPAPAAPRPAPSPSPAVAPAPPRPPAPYEGALNPNAPEELLYRRGAYYVDKRRWDKAIEAYEAVRAKKAARADAATYWKAYALGKSGARDQALALLKELETSFPQSRWLNDARALQLELKQASGQRVSPEEQQDEDLKLIAIQGLSQTDPGRALPLLEKMLIGKGSPSLKGHALFLLSQIQQPRSRELLIEIAKGKVNPDLQAKAVQVLGMQAGAEDLVEIYMSAGNDENLKRAVIEVLSLKKNAAYLVKIARTETDPRLKKEIVQMLAMSRSKEASEFLAEMLEK